MVTMRLRKPYTTASVWSSGKVTCTGATSEQQARIAARRITRAVSKLGYPRLRLVNYRVVNVLGTCTMPFAIKITPFSAKHRELARLNTYISISSLSKIDNVFFSILLSYEPELHPGVTYRLKDPKATLKIFSTGSITVTGRAIISDYECKLVANVNNCFLMFLAPCVNNVQSAIEHIYPLVYEFRKERSPEEIEAIQAALRLRGLKRKRQDFPPVDEEFFDEEEEEEFDSDRSHD
jgi:transcription initiation factor TFIID TATA-box-binding protein